ncbi:MAG: MaoC family dehydratase N-terminal domain-containing protein, partial [Nocardioidaceae bacterium]
MSSWQDWIGRTYTTSAVLDPVHANRMAVTLDRQPKFADGDVLPPGWHWLYFHDLVPASHLGPDGHPRLGETMPPVPLPRRMWAGGNITFLEPLRLGAAAIRTSTIRDITHKIGRTGELYFVTVDHDVSASGRPALAATQTIVYRETATGPATIDGPPAPHDAEFTEDWQFDSTALFRYSALTFNGHRIHYDADYAQSAEGYPNVVIHGPLLATLLMDLANSHGPLCAFRFRAL